MSWLAQTCRRLVSQLPEKFKVHPDSVRIGDPVVDCSGLQTPVYQSEPATQLTSCLCNATQLRSDAFRFWASELRMPWRLHRKLWEHCYILQSLHERNLLRQGSRGLGFAVGQEPLPALMAKYGCQIVATDLDVADSRSECWADTDQLTLGLDTLHHPKILGREAFEQSVTYRPADMNRIPTDLNDFDFTWSTCSFEHCGSLELGADFLLNQMDCLKPGGVAVHTTEYNLTSDRETITDGPTVIYRRCDVINMIDRLIRAGHRVEPLSLQPGTTPQDRHIDLPPYSETRHMKLKLFDRFVTSSVALIVQKDAAAAPSISRAA